MTTSRTQLDRMYEERARQHKATAAVDALFYLLDHTSQIDQITPETLDRLDDAGWKALGLMVGRKLESDETRARVRADFRSRWDARLRLATMTTDELFDLGGDQ